MTPMSAVWGGSRGEGGSVQALQDAECKLRSSKDAKKGQQEKHEVFLSFRYFILFHMTIAHRGWRATPKLFLVR